MTLEQIDAKIKAAIEEATNHLKTEIADLKRVRRVNRWLIAGFALAAAIAAPIFAASLMSGNFGIGIASPLDTLDVNGDIRVRGADLKDAGGTNRIRITDNGASNIYDAGGTIRLSIADNGNTNFFDSNGSTRISLNSAGDIGMGISNPNAKLDVRGEIRLGGAGQYFTSKAQENIMIIRGFFNGSSNPPSSQTGTGWSVTKTGQGQYTINFSTAFSGTAMPMANGGGNSISICRPHSWSTTNMTIRCQLADGSYQDDWVQFVAIGPRAP